LSSRRFGSAGSRRRAVRWEDTWMRKREANTARTGERRVDPRAGTSTRKVAALKPRSANHPATCWGCRGSWRPWIRRHLRYSGGARRFWKEQHDTTTPASLIIVVVVTDDVVAADLRAKCQLQSPSGLRQFVLRMHSLCRCRQLSQWPNSQMSIAVVIRTKFTPRSAFFVPLLTSIHWYHRYLTYAQPSKALRT
jgi:hypothetical protein